MAIRDQIPQVIEDYKSRLEYLEHNQKLLRIYEGDLLTEVKCEMKKQFSDRAYEQVVARCAPVNILIKIVDKLSKIYQGNVVRYPRQENPADSALLSWYEQNLHIDSKMNSANEFFNLFKTALIQPYVHMALPRLRIIPSDRFVVFSNDPVDPLNPTMIVLVHGVQTYMTGEKTVIFHAYTDSEFVIFNSKGEVLTQEMSNLGNIEGINPFGKLPFVYVNKSENWLMPIQDSDTMKMTTLIPILLSDLNYAVMYQSFSIMYGINIDNKNLEKNPDAFWSFKSDDPEFKPEVGVIKPQVDIAEVLNLIQSELSIWLNSRGIKPGSIGQLQGDSFASGISKMIDEMDTYEDRKEQIAHFKKAETHLWDLILNYMHPYWVKAGLIENRAIWTPSNVVITEFQEPKPMVSRMDLISEVKAEVEAGFLTKADAIKRLNPEMTDDAVREYMMDLSSERTITVPDLGVMNGQETNPAA